jgi:uncharacterized protein
VVSDRLRSSLAPLSSADAGIERFLVLETCVGVRPEECYAPYGLAGLYAGTLTANPLVPHENLFERKVGSYRKRWSWLTLNGDYEPSSTK